MSQITIDSVRAFRNGNNFKRGNTQVKTYAHSNYRELLLHGNVIAYMNENGLFISNGGYEPDSSRYRSDTPTGSVTTKDRLNGLPNVSIYQRNFQWYLNGELWGGEFIRVQ
tara:strand:- start:19 stop:351 length:333 start_codon:yes stop_codon:yes gene_type:complete